MDKLNKEEMEAVITTVRAMTIFQAGILLSDELPDKSVFKKEMKKAHNRLVAEMKHFEITARTHIDAFNEFLSDEYKLVMFKEAERIVEDLKAVSVEFEQKKI